jgi:hypothetical protein
VGCGPPVAQFFNPSKPQNLFMNNFFRALIAGYGAKKLGGGCFSMIIIFVIIYWLLGYANC